MSEGFLDDRRRALEESFFHKRNAQLMTELRDQLETEAKHRELASVSGITDPDVLDRFIKLNMTADTVAALALVPLVRVAWADDDLDKKELAAIMVSATKSGIKKGSASFRCLESWLDQKPDDALNEAWLAYVKELTSSLSADDKHAMKNALLAQAIRVAQAAGGVLGVGSKVSDVEKVILDELAAAFE